MSSSSVSLGRNLVSLKWEDFNMFVVSELAALYQKDDLTDVTLFCEGRSFRAHKVLLSLWSTYFRDVFRGTTHSHPVVIVRETNSSDLELILRFIYQGHLLIPIEETDRFLKTAEHFQVAGLKNMRLHVPNFSYPAGTTAAFNEEPVVHQQVHNVSSNMNEPVVSRAGSSQLLTITSNLHGQQHCGHLRNSNNVAGAAVSTSTVVHPHAQPQPTIPVGATVNLGNELSPSHTGSLPPQSHQCPPSPVPEATFHHHHHHPESGQQQVIRQSSSRAAKHGINVSYSSPPSTGFQSNVGSQAVSPSGGGVGVVTRIPSESVIYQPQPVLIFQNGSSTQILKPGEQYATRGGDTRTEHSMMVLEGVVSESSINIEPSTTNTHTTHLSSSNSGGTSYTVYDQPSTSQASSQHVHHHSSPEASGEESILGLPYPDENVSARELSHQQPSGQDPPGLHLPHQHQLSEMHSSKHMEMESESVVVTHPYTPPSASSSISYDPLANGNSGSSNSSSNFSHTSSKCKVSSSPSSISPPDVPVGVSQVQATTVHSAPVYAVKRIPPPLPPSLPSPTQTQARSFRNVVGKNDIPSSRVITSSPPAAPPPHNSSGNAISTRSKSSSFKGASSSKLGQKSTSQSNPSASTSNVVGSVGVKDTRGTVSGQGSSRKVVLVPCPKCGKKVKQTSLKVHMKRTHLEEGTVLVCPICSKRISSKGVYYKHMYIHRKRSEASDKASNSSSTLIKTETQGT
ncbi:unnamed protein product [Orchesella dallaii]|uniref:BTB domain-containing protein n=1 Tax=Orchesella dallaii TaxID=48710 RepID=A0ABP1Q5N2_9HEXA